MCTINRGRSYLIIGIKHSIVTNSPCPLQFSQLSVISPQISHSIQMATLSTILRGRDRKQMVPLDSLTSKSPFSYLLRPNLPRQANFSDSMFNQRCLRSQTMTGSILSRHNKSLIRQVALPQSSLSPWF